MYVKNKDTIDVWFDAGCTHQTVLRGTHPGNFPADLYLEGSDQHRGWFQSSLLTSSMLDGCSPYKALLTHGFVVDGSGRKMSKSAGNGIEPQTIFNTLGADILRLWVASTDYSGEITLSEEFLKRITESYRRIRNTLRFLLANTSDFDASKDLVAVKDMLEIDRYAIAQCQALQTDFLTHYQQFEFHPVIAKLQSYCSEDLGGFYLDILKDRLYTSGVNSPARRSAQSALWHITHSLLRLIAPTLSFTAEEAWKFFASSDEYRQSDETIFTQLFYTLPEVADAEALLAKYDVLRTVRLDVTKQLEEVRAAGGIGSSLQADLIIRASGSKYDLIASLGDDLKFIFITSSAKVEKVTAIEEESISVTASTHQKCERCWHCRNDVGMHSDHPSICKRCVENVFGPGEVRHFA
jgi:isoleucyl-tRNA synthetase